MGEQGHGKIKQRRQQINKEKYNKIIQTRTERDTKRYKIKRR